MIPQHRLHHHAGDVASSLVLEYVQINSPITTGLENRIEFVSKKESETSRKIQNSGGKSMGDSDTVLLVLSLFVTYILRRFDDIRLICCIDVID